MSTAPPLRLANTTSDPPSVSQGFDETLRSLQIEPWKSIASDQQQRLRERLRSRLEVIDSYLTGSYRRNTQIFPLNDIDLLLVLDRDAYIDVLLDPVFGPSRLLDAVEAALREAYPTSEIERHECCIRIQFAGTRIGFDVIPAFQRRKDEFLIPNTDLFQWVLTNPKEHQRLVSEANQRHGGMLVPLIKLLKACNEAMGKPLHGFHVEMMVYYALQTTPVNYREGVANLLDSLARGVWSPVLDPWPQGRQVDEYLSDEKRAKAAAGLGVAAAHARDAVAAEARGDDAEAHQLWEEVFGHWYPVEVPAPSAKKLTPPQAIKAVSSASRIAATSAGLVGLSPGLASASTGTSHGGSSPHRRWSWSGTEPDVGWHEREIQKVLRQFTAMTRLTPAEAAADPAVWPVRESDVDELYAVLVGDQYSNLGIRHRLLVLIPKDAPAIEPAMYDLRPYQPKKITAEGWKPKRRLAHHWRGGVLCTHAARDRWDGHLVTLMIWAADWLFRQDYRQMRGGRWIGPQIDDRGRYVLNGVVQSSDRPGQARRVMQ